MTFFLDTGLEWTVLAGLSGISFVASFISASLGIGGGALLLTVLASVVPPIALIPVHGVIQLGSNVGRAVIMRKYLDRRVIAGFFGGAILGVILGGLVAARLPGSLVLIGVGCFVLWSVLIPLPKRIFGSTIVAGAVSSTLTMFFGATGPLVATWIKTFNFDRLTHVATQSTCLTLQHLLKTLMFGFLGFSFVPWLPLMLLMIIAGFMGTLVGRSVLIRINDKKFRIALNIVLVLLALRLIWQGVTELL